MLRTRCALLLVAGVLLLTACDSGKSRVSHAAAEKVYTMRGVIKARDPRQSTITVDHEAIPGFMEAMTMDYPVRGTAIDRLPPVGSAITARLHVTDDAFWLTDVQLRR
jgi:protein SCO1/2